MDSRLLVLSLHRLGSPPSNAKIRGLFISPRALRFQLSLVRALGYRFMTLREAMTERRGLRAVVTFDDGYADNYSSALPILRAMEIPATLFVITGDVGKRMVVWDEADEDIPADMLTWDQIRALRRAGWEIGSHSDRHVHLERRTEEEQTRLIGISCDIIEDKVGAKPSSFAYPYGTFSETTKRVLRRHGFDFAVTTFPSKADDLCEDLLEIGRTSIVGRHFYHDIRNVRRIGTAVGTTELLRGVGFYSLSIALSPVSTSFSFLQTNK